MHKEGNHDSLKCPTFYTHKEGKPRLTKGLRSYTSNSNNLGNATSIRKPAHKDLPYRRRIAHLA